MFFCFLAWSNIGFDLLSKIPSKLGKPKGKKCASEVEKKKSSINVEILSKMKISGTPGAKIALEQVDENKSVTGKTTFFEKNEKNPQTETNVEIIGEQETHVTETTEEFPQEANQTSTNSSYKQLSEDTASLFNDLVNSEYYVYVMLIFVFILIIIIAFVISRCCEKLSVCLVKRESEPILNNQEDSEVGFETL